MQRQWHRVPLDRAPQGHGLARPWPEQGCEFIAFERDGGDWQVWRQGPGEDRTEAVVLPEFADVRAHVEEAVVVYSRNPFDFSTVGGPAIAGTVIGMLLGGLPGVLLHHSPLTIVGVQVGAVAGAAAGAAYGARKSKSKGSTAALKAKLLK